MVFSCLGCDIAGDGNYACFIGALCELISRIWSQARLVEAHGRLSVKVRSARETVTLAAGRKLERNDKGYR